MTRSFQTFLLPQTVLAVSKADEGLLEQPGFQVPEAGGKLIPVHTSSCGREPAARLPWILIPVFLFSSKQSSIPAASGTLFFSRYFNPLKVFPSHTYCVHFRTISFVHYQHSGGFGKSFLKKSPSSLKLLSAFFVLQSCWHSWDWQPLGNNPLGSHLGKESFGG